MPVTFPCTDKDGNYYDQVARLAERLGMSKSVVYRDSKFNSVKDVDMLIDLCLLKKEVNSMGVRVKFTEDFIKSRYEHDNCNPDKAKFPQKINGVVYVNEQHMGRCLGFESMCVRSKVQRFRENHSDGSYNVRDLYEYMKVVPTVVFPDIFPNEKFSCFTEYAGHYGVQGTTQLRLFIEKNREFIKNIEDFIMFGECFEKDGINNKSLGKYLLSKGINHIDTEPLVFVDYGVSFSTLTEAYGFFKFRDATSVSHLFSTLGMLDSSLKERVKMCERYKQFIENDSLALELGYSSILELISSLHASRITLFAVYYRDCNSNSDLFKKEILKRQKSSAKMSEESSKTDRRIILSLGIFNPKDVDNLCEEGVLKDATKPIINNIKDSGLSYGDIYRLLYVYKSTKDCREIGKWLIGRREGFNLNKQNTAKFLIYDMYNKEDLSCDEAQLPVHGRSVSFNTDRDSIKERYHINIRKASYFYINGLYLVPNLSEGCKRFGIPIYRLDNEVSLEERERIFTENYISYRMSKHNGIVTAFLRIEDCVYDDCYRCEFYNQIVYLTATDIIWLRVLTANVGVSTKDNIGIYNTVEELCNFYSVPTDYYYSWLACPKKSNNIALHLIRKGGKLWEEDIKGILKEQAKLVIQVPEIVSTGDLKLKKVVFDSIKKAYRNFSIDLDTTLEKTNEEHIKYIEDILLKREEMKLILFDMVFDSKAHVIDALGISVGYLRKGIKQCTEDSKPLNFKNLENWLLTKYYTRGSLKRNPDRKIGSLEIKRYSFTDSDGLDWFSVIDWDRGVMKNMSSTDLMLKKVELCRERMQNEQ